MLSYLLGCEIDGFSSFQFLSRHPKILKLLIDLNVRVGKIDSLLALAIKENNIPIVKTLLCGNVGYIDVYQALYEAIKCKNTEIVEILLSSDDLDKYFYSVLWEAISCKNTAIIEILLAGKTKVDKGIADEIWDNYDKHILSILIKHGLNLNLLYFKRGDLSFEKKEEKERNYRYLLNGDKNGLKQLKCAFLHKAIVTKKPERINDLIELGADINVKDESGCSPLWLACRIGDTRVVGILVQSGADVNREDNDGYVPLILSVYQRKHEITKILILFGAKTDVTDKKGRGLLHFALEGSPYGSNGDYITKIIELLLAQNIDIGNVLNAKDDFGNTPLHVAIRNNGCEVAKLLIDSGADVNVINNHNESPLIMAITHFFYTYSNVNINFEYTKWVESNKWKRLIELLIENSNTEIINSRSFNGKTCLHFVVEANSVFFAKSLLKKGCDINIKDNCGFIASQYAQSMEMKQLLKNPRKTMSTK